MKRLLLILCVVTASALLAAEGRSEAVPAAQKEPREPEMVLVPGGCHDMGAADGNGDEKPVHRVCVSDFYIGKYEVTQRQWFGIMGTSPSRFGACGADCPVEQVSWTDAQEFISRLNRLTGKSYRLPTEAEWEFACTSGGKGEKYCGGNDSEPLAWHEGNSASRPHPVGLRQPNGLGIYDMSGNVSEWVEDWKVNYSPAPQSNPHNNQSGSTRVRRGGSFHYGSFQARAAWRSSGYPDDRALDIGFRLALPSAPGNRR